ncbi:hypothetical protein DWV00_30510 [Trinickia dinghuensis]|uniref:Fimbrial protein FimV n=1 Tax=Trinickia dinghuensis TaxID=2291023 RepID=A0A3D8JQ31_9BURK|nr:hypothetical protein DWV00_30510 [Trinickia dinghuensis]
MSSLQQLLTLKNRVLMELQRHGVGAPQAAHPGAAGSAPAGASASGFAAAPASGPAAVPAPGKSRAAAAANQRFVGASGSGFDLSRNVFPIVGAVVAAIVAALLVVLVALGVSRRRQAAPAAGATGAAGGSAAGVASSARSDEPAQPAAAPAQTADDPIAAEFLAVLARNPTSKRALMGLAAHYAERKNVQGFDEIAQRIYRLTGGRGPNWTHVASIGRQLDPHNSLYALEAGEADELVLSPGEDAGASAVPPSETSHPEPQAEAAAPRAAEVPPDVPPVPQPAPLHETPPAADASHVAHRSAAEEAPGEEVPPDHPGSHEPAALSEQGDGTLPPEAIAALDGLDIGLPPRVGPAGESPAYPPEAELGEPEPAWEEGPAAESAAGTEKSAHDVPSPGASTEHAEESEKGVREAHDAHEANAAPAAPAVSGLGAAPVGRLNLSFDLDLPGAHAREGKDGGEQSDIAPVPQFTPEQLARIARNKLELAAEYIALGDLGGARTLIHEVIESNDTATHDEAHAMLATLAPLS